MTQGASEEVIDKRVHGEPVLDVKQLKIAARVDGQPRVIVDSVDLMLRPGETIGIVGESGSGKSMTARALLNLLPEGVSASGVVRYGQRNLLALGERQLREVRGRELGLVLQDPFTMLNPLRTCGLHIVERLRDSEGHRLSKAARQREAVRRLAEVGIRDPAVSKRFPFQLSGGMRQRVGIAAALALDPQVIIADEPSTALDVTTQREILGLLKALQQARGMGLVLITHDLRVAFAMCDRVYVMYAGRILEAGKASEIEAEPRHPYSLALLLSEPPGDRRVDTLPAIPGNVPHADDVGDSCAFAPRCRWAAEECLTSEPTLDNVGDDHLSACRRAGAIFAEMREFRERAGGSPGQEPRRQEETVTALLSVRDLKKDFHVGSRGRDTTRVAALGGVSLTIRPGESVGLVGESGSGKSTLARCLVGLETPSHGAIAIGGTDASDFRSLSDADRLRIRRTVQIVFQDPYSSLNPVRTIGSALREALILGGVEKKELTAGVRALLAQVGLPDTYGRRKPVSLSGGERQRVAIARALATQPELLVLDEPVSALDVSVQAQILNLFERIREERQLAYLFISHDLAVVRQVVDRVYVMFQGMIVEEGDVDKVLDRPSHAYTASLIDSLPRSDGTWLRSAVPAPEESSRAC